VIDASAAADDLVLDFYGGSGTTAHATIELNRDDDGTRRYVVMECGSHFDSVLLPRLKRIIYSKDWKDGQPVSRIGGSHLFKYIRLESYEDCLNNLELERTKSQDDLLTQAKDFREDYTLRYMLDVETRGSASLLNVQKFTDPFSYKLKVSTGTVGETKEVNVDLVETFNWLVGLTVKHIDHIRNVRVIEGTNPQGDRVLILWRNVAEVPNDKLDEWFNTQGYNPRDQEYDLIYVNGDNNIENLRRGDQTWKVRLIEEDFHRLMWECQDV
jgi:adenine-specific DNA-methyltransferase